MPRLNYGTLLENIVVTESTRICLDQSSVDEPVAFASAFAMPPLTQCWCKPSEVANSPCFNDAFLRQLAAKHSAPQTLEQFWSLCINNTPNVANPSVPRRSGAPISVWRPKRSFIGLHVGCTTTPSDPPLDKR